MRHGSGVLVTVKAAVAWVKANPGKGTLLFFLLFGLSLAVGWFRMEPARNGPVTVGFERLRLELAQGELNVIEANLLAKGVTSLSGDALELDFDGCPTTPGPRNATAVSLRAKDANRGQAFGLSSFTWLADRGPTTLFLEPGGEGLTGSISAPDGCRATMALTLATKHDAVISYNPAPNEPPTLASGAKVIWRPRGPVGIHLRDTGGLLVPQNAKVAAVIGKLAEPLPRVGERGSRNSCKATAGDTIRLPAEAWDLGDFKLAGGKVTLTATSRDGVLALCTGATAQGLASCAISEDACGFDWGELWEKSKLPGLVELALGLLAMRGCGAP